MSSIETESQEKAEKLASSLKQTDSKNNNGFVSLIYNPKGIFDPKIVRGIFFILFYLGLFTSAGIEIASIWGFVASETSLRVIMTCCIIVITFGLFVLGNEGLVETLILWPNKKNESNNLTEK